MSQILLVIISGPPCTGKTTLAKRISTEFRLPLISKDGIKESLFDSLGWKDRQWSMKLSLASYGLIYYFLESQLTWGRALIVESNFKPEYDTEKFLDLKKKYNFKPFQIQCKTNGQVLWERFKKRSQSGERHPGHVDHLTYEEFKPSLLKGENEILDIGGKVFEVDTTDFGNIDYEGLFVAIQSVAKDHLVA